MNDPTQDLGRGAISSASLLEEQGTSRSEPVRSEDSDPSAPRPPDDVPDAMRSDEEEHRAGVVFWVGLVIGVLVVANGVRGLLASDVRWIRSAGAWFVAGGVLVDLAVVPIIGVVGLAGQRLLPGWAWRVVRAALFITALLVAFSYVLVFEPDGGSPNPTVRPRNYEQGLLVYVAAVWVLAGLGLVASWFLERREASSL